MKKITILSIFFLLFVSATSIFAEDGTETKHKSIILGEELKMTCNTWNQESKIQWYKDGSILYGQMGEKLIYPSVKMSDAGTYYAVVEGACGFIKTNDMVVTINVPVQPGIETAVAGGDYLFQNEPNPAGESIRFKFMLSSSSNVQLILNDAFGNKVASIFDGIASTGLNTVDFRPSEFNLSNGAYFYTIISGNFKETKSLILMR